MVKANGYPVYQNIVTLQHQFSSFGDDNRACQLTHIIAAAVIIPKVFSRKEITEKEPL
jgi:hypothetical protein